MDLVYFNVEYLFFVVYSALNSVFSFDSQGGQDDLSAQIVVPDIPKIPKVDVMDVKEITGVAPSEITFWDIFTFVIVLVSLILIAGICYAIFRMSQVKSREHTHIHEMERALRPQKYNKQWELVQQHVETNEPRSWEVALREADLLLLEHAREKHIPESELEKYRGWKEYTKEGGDVILTKKRTREFLEEYKKALRKLTAL